MQLKSLRFWQRPASVTPAVETRDRSSCSGCTSSCFSKPLEFMPKEIQAKLEQIRGALIEARSFHIGGQLESARKKATEVKRLVSELSSSGNFRDAIDKMFAVHVPEPEIQLFIARS